jgi:hypothetical protein
MHMRNEIPPGDSDKWIWQGLGLLAGAIAVVILAIAGLVGGIISFLRWL